MKRILKLFVLLLMIEMSVSISVKAGEFTPEQRQDVECIVDTCIYEWDTYGVLPSVAISQAYVESHIGKRCKSFNYWGLGCGAYSYETLENGIYGYLKTINNGHYDKALFCFDPVEQIKYIKDGGYCSDENYVGKVTSIIDEFDLTKYDNQLFNALKAKEYFKSLTPTYLIIYEESIPENKISIGIDSDINDNYAAYLYSNGNYIGLYEVEKSDDMGYVIKTSDKSLAGKMVTVRLFRGIDG